MRRLPRESFEEELFGVRAMRHLYRIRTPLNASEWKIVLQPVRSASLHFLLSREQALLEPSFGEAAREGRGWKRASPEWRHGGHSSFEPRSDGMD